MRVVRAPWGEREGAGEKGVLEEREVAGPMLVPCTGPSISMLVQYVDCNKEVSALATRSVLVQYPRSWTAEEEYPGALEEQSWRTVRTISVELALGGIGGDHPLLLQSILRIVLCCVCSGS